MRVDRDRFLEEGYLVVPEVVPSGRLEAVRAAYEILVERQRQIWASERKPDDPPGGAWETSAQPRLALSGEELSAAIAAQGGAALLIDYGHMESAPGDTLQAIKGHRYADVLADPGAADVTAHVDFAAIAAVAGAVRVSGPVTQGAFLGALGIEARAAQLRAGATPRQAGEVLEGLKRLIAPAEMGSLFKVMALTNRDQPAPEGFA